MKRYDSEKEISDVVRGFENGTIRRENWRHAEHLTVAAYYLWHHDFETSLVKMRDGIFNLLKAFEVDLNIEMPYHETLTVFWLRTVKDFEDSKNGCSIVEVCNELIENSTKIIRCNFTHANCFFPTKRE